jgi:N-acetylmuramoyl-L-alanine amidase
VAAIGPRLEQGAKGPRLVLEWPGEFAPSAAPVPASAASISSQPANVAQVASPAPTPPKRSEAEMAAASAAATSRLISDLARQSAAQAPQSVQSAPASAARQLPPATATVPAAAGSISGAPDRSTVYVPPAQAPATGVPAPIVANADSRPLTDTLRSRPMRPLVIAIDPGHGGQDPGAIGQSGKREKDITLAIARELARQINATPGLKAYLTRDHDVFIPLNRRAQLARQAKADMFVSIHADAAENRSANGSSVYVLSLKGASSQRARWLADKENASDLVGGVRLEPSSTLTSVLLDLTQSGQMKASEDAASHVLSGLGRLGRNHKPHVERANFAVLRTSDMPAMLVETAFISNPDEERRLSDPASQRQIARAVLDGVNTYFVRQPPPGTLYAARAAAQAPAPARGAGGSP